MQRGSCLAGGRDLLFMCFHCVRMFHFDGGCGVTSAAGVPRCLCAGGMGPGIVKVRALPAVDRPCRLLTGRCFWSGVVAGRGGNRRSLAFCPSWLGNSSGTARLHRASWSSSRGCAEASVGGWVDDLESTVYARSEDQEMLWRREVTVQDQQIELQAKQEDLEIRSC
ncbi:hypothetical protein NDU88_002090 [Pleurodeles waltl]|uniref:Uncharacterized protein n=1 Tax=Pleurodeles waltl TaxID=8319 RepID=A0AAV7SCR3_PLEWA|nr:hypothetical protein NDU88_002090 [Pleurodeles waltl]